MYANAETARLNIAYATQTFVWRHASLDEDMTSGVRPEVVAVSRQLLADAEKNLAYWTAYGANVHGVRTDFDGYSPVQLTAMAKAYRANASLPDGTPIAALTDAAERCEARAAEMEAGKVEGYAQKLEALTKVVGDVLRDLGDVTRHYNMGGSQEQLEAARRDLLAAYIAVTDTRLRV